jgi:hypothetical protein
MRPFFVPLLLLLGCTKDLGVEAQDDTSVVDDSGSAGDVSPFAISSSVSDVITTVTEVTWQTEHDSEGYVVFGETDQYGHQTPATDLGTTHSRLLLGMPANTNVHFRVVTTDGVVSYFSEDQVIRTGYLPSALPEFYVWGTSVEGYRTLTVWGTWTGIILVDSLGRVVWYYEHTDDDTISLQARLTRDGKHVVFNSPCHLSDKADCGSMIWVTMDGKQKTRLPVDGIAHDFTQLRDGTLCAIVQEMREVDGRETGADRLVELNIDGEQREVWNAWDSLEPPATDEDLVDWTHGNAINHNPEDDAYYVGLAYLSSIVKIERSTGEILWKFGGTDSDFVLSEESEGLLIHHNFDLLDDVLTIFVNGTNSDDHSRVVQYELDSENMTAHESWRYATDAELYVFALGDVSHIAPDTLHVTWSSSGFIEQVTGDEPTWSLSASFPHAFGYSNFYTSMYPEGLSP